MQHFEKLNAIDVSKKTETKKTGNTELKYLSWAWAWSEVKKVYPDANYEIIKNENGLPFFCDEMTGYVVFTKVTIENTTHEMWLPVMDGANKAMKSSSYTYQVAEYNYGKKTGNMIDKTVEACTMFDINKTLMRCLTKNLAMFGLGLYIYAGEDLPEQAELDKPESKSIKMATEEQLQELESLEVDFTALCKAFKLSHLSELTFEMAEKAIAKKKEQK